MFSPVGYVPFAISRNWIWDHAKDFYEECALPWAAGESREQKLNGGDDLRPFGLAMAGRTLFVEWMVNFFLVFQPVPVYVSSRDGAIMRASDLFFSADEHLCWYEFDWPLTDDELRPIVENMAPEEVFRGRFQYHFWNPRTTCIEVPSEAKTSGLPEEARHLLELVRPFNGWSVCLKIDECNLAEDILASQFNWREIGVGPAVGGRPRKQEIARKLYLSVFPNGHEVEGYTWGGAALKVGELGKMSVSVDTLRRGLAAAG